MQVINSKLPSDAFDLRYQRDAAAETLLKWLSVWQKPSWTPEARLAAKSDHAWIRQTPSRQRRLSMKGGGGLRTLGQFFKFAAKHVVHSKPARDLLRTIDAPPPPRVAIHLFHDTT